MSHPQGGISSHSFGFVFKLYIPKYQVSWFKHFLYHLQRPKPFLNSDSNTFQQRVAPALFFKRFLNFRLFIVDYILHYDID